MLNKALIFSLVCYCGLVRAGIVAEYTFNQNLNNSASSGYALSEVGGNGGAYQEETVFGVNKYVLSLDKDEGLQVNMSSWTGSDDVYTIVLDVSLSNVTNYQKLTSFDNPDESDRGWYTVSNDVAYLANSGSSVLPNKDPLDAGAWTRLAITRNGGSISLYQGDSSSMTLQGSVTGSSDTYALIGSILTILRDDSGTSRNEDYALKVSGLWISDTAMTTAEMIVVPELSSVTLSALALLTSLLGMRLRRWRNRG